MLKRGQITLFVVLGIIAIGVTLFLFFFLNKEKTAFDSQGVLNTGSIQSYVDNCIHSTVQKALLKNGRKGGYFFLPSSSTTEFYENVPYFLEDGTVLFPSDQVLAEEIAHYVDALLILCLNDFEHFKAEGYNITAEESSSQATIGETKVFIKTKLPLMIKKGGAVKELSAFKVEVAAPQLYENWKALRSVLNSSKGGKLCLACLAKKAEQKDWIVQALPLGISAQTLDITDNNYLIGTETYHMRFAVRHNESVE